MATATLSPKYLGALSDAFELVSTSKDSSLYRMAGRSLATPFTLEISRKIGPNGASANDHVIVRIVRVDRNATTQKLATASVTLDVSIPRDTTATAAADVVAMMGTMASLINDCSDLAATTTNRTKLVNGRDL